MLLRSRYANAQFINRTRSQLVCISNALRKDSIQIKSREKLTLLNENILPILKKRTKLDFRILPQLQVFL
jgi:hypothetical protein